MSIREPKESGWYLARRWPTETNDLPPTVVRVTLDEEGGVTTVWEIGKRDPSPLADWRLEAKIHRDARATDLEIDEIRRGAYEHGVEMGRKAERATVQEYERQRERECPVFHADIRDIDFREVGEPVIALRMPSTYAGTLSEGLSDLLCWAQGFRAALAPDDMDRHPMGIETVRLIRETITTAQRVADGAKS